MAKHLMTIFPGVAWASIFAASVMLMACDSGSDAGPASAPVTIEESSLEGMLRVHATGSFAMLGTSSEKAKAIERPQMRVNFDYDFSIGRTEVTCGEFNELLKDFEISAGCENDSLPAVDMSYYEAVLFANARSKSEGLDTAYTYSAMTYTAGHVADLEGFAFHPDVEAYRLPTEAEWVLVAGQKWNVSQSVNASNSDYKMHEVCSRGADSVGVCDMEGNVKEWVSDWLGNFADTTLDNYVGAPDGGNLGQRVVKGGCFHDETDAINLYSRGDVYTVISSTRKEYIGFRLAYGAIPDAQWMDYRSDASESRVMPLASSSAIRKITGTYQSKMVFRNEMTGNLDLIDFSSGVVSVSEIKDTLAVYHPAISPDGHKVAFSTREEGVSGASSLYVRDLNAAGGNLVKLDVKSAAIPRWQVMDGDTSIVYVTDAGNNSDTQSFMEQSTWRVSFKEGAFGTPEKLFDGAYHGGVSADGNLAVTGARLLRARVNGVDTVWFNGDQACNASLSREGKRTLFLDFGSRGRTDYEGESYGVHERILVVDSVGNLVEHFDAPSGYAFDHTEWASDSLIVASLTNSNGAHEKIVILDTRDASITEVAEGDELWHPDLWFRSQGTGEEGLLDFDSAGVYYVSGVAFYGLELRVKMERFWTQMDEASVVALGSSRTLFGLNEQFFSSGVLLNMGFSSGDFSSMYYLFKNYVLKHGAAKTVVIEFSPDFLITDVNSTWNSIYQVAPGYRYDESHDFWPDGVSDAFVLAVKDSYRPTDSLNLPYSFDEFLLSSNGWGEATLHRDSNSVMETYRAEILANMDTLRSMCQMAKEHGITLIALIPPQNPGYKNTGAFGMYGIRRSDAMAVIDSVKRMDIILMDENRMGDHDYGDDMAYNTDHLSRAGAAKMTQRLDSLIQTLK